MAHDPVRRRALPEGHAQARPWTPPLTVHPPDPERHFDFRDPHAAAAWAAIDDRVMGGCSQSRLRADAQGHAVFEGVVSLRNGGGFASVRSAPGALGHPGAQALCLRVRGPALDYKLSLFTDDGFDSLGYQAGFRPQPAAWTVVVLPLADFMARWRGRELPGAPPLQAARVRQIGLLRAGRQAGAFALDVAWIGWAASRAAPGDIDD
ncbi:MAG: CIA30 family protein [Rubrivivax sp.]|nr:CIA30 family protein [Rubrivivax sp.]